MSERLKKLYERRGPIRRVGVIGMGYVGIPSAMAFADSGAVDFVWGVQRKSPSSGYKIAALNAGENPLKGKEPGLEALIEKVVRLKKFKCTSDFSKLLDVDAVTVTVQTPFLDTANLQHDFGALQEALEAVGRNISEGSLVVLESTIAPGTTDGFARRILEDVSDMVAGEDFGLAHAPERVMVGRLLRNIREHDRIVGGINEASTKRAIQLYSPVVTDGKIIHMSAKAAEVTKTAENALRDLQIAAMNELALYCEAMHINVYDVRTGINSLKAASVSRGVLYPGAGVGGHCLTKDSYLLELGVKDNALKLDYPQDTDSLFVLARKINDFMPEHMYHLTVSALKRVNKDLKGLKIAVLGWAFTKNSGDSRNTPSEPYHDMLIREGAYVKIHDPYAEGTSGITVSHNLKDVLRGVAAIAIMTAHDEYLALTSAAMKGLSGQRHPAIIDGRNVVDPDEFIKSGFVYKGIGRGDKNQHPIEATTDTTPLAI